MFYNSYQIADIIGVNVSTIKRWTDSGKLQCYQTAGGHRKFHLNHISEYLKNNTNSSTSIKIDQLVGKNINLIESINNLDFNFLINYAFKNIILGNNNEFYSLNNSLILKGYPIYLLFDNILIPLLKKIGDEWSKNKLTITEEHLASEIIRKFLSHLNFQQPHHNSKYNAFCFTLINDKHDIPIQMGEAILNQNENIKTFNLGPNLPIDDFINLSKKIHPDIIFISIIYIENDKVLKNQIDLLFSTFDQSKTKIIIRGIGAKKINLKCHNYIQIDSFKNFYQKIIQNY